MNNTIRLIHESMRLTKEEFKKFNKGDLLLYESPEELKRWNINQKEEARIELKKYKCSYEKDGEFYNIEEYGLEIFEADEDGDFLVGSDFDFAECRLESFNDLLFKHDVTIKFLSERFEIPYRTLQNWKGGQRECPSYVLRMMDTLLSDK